MLDIYRIPILFNIVRNIINFGRFTSYIAESLDIKEGEYILDVGCGTGDYSDVIGQGCKYLGIDINPYFINYAKEKYFRHKEYKEFVLGDILELNLKYPKKYFDKTIYISMMHHFNDIDNRKILRAISDLTKEIIIIVDPILLEGHPIQKLFLLLDRGKNIRTREEQKNLIEDVLDILDSKIFTTRSHSVTMSLFKCRNKI